MNNHTKTKLIYIFTFGIAYVIAKKRAKDVLSQKKDEIKHPEAKKFDIDKFISLLGGVENIIDAIPTISSLKVICKTIELVNQNEIKKMGAKGSVISQNKITILIGDISYDIANQIKNVLAK